MELIDLISTFDISVKILIADANGNIIYSGKALMFPAATYNEYMFAKVQNIWITAAGEIGVEIEK